MDIQRGTTIFSKEGNDLHALQLQLLPSTNVTNTMHKIQKAESKVFFLNCFMLTLRLTKMVLSKKDTIYYEDLSIQSTLDNLKF